MAVSITQRPADWSPVNNPVFYKFTTTGGPFTNYRIEIEVFKASDDTSLSGVKSSFTPNSSNVTTADISAILKSILYRDWELPSSVNEGEDGIGSVTFYIKYQELYTGSATSQASDSSNTKIGVLAALQIGSNSDLDLYVPEDSTKKFLTKFDIPKLWTGYAFTISFLYPESVIDNTYVVSSPSAWANGPDAFDTKNATHFIKASMSAGIIYQANFTPLAISIPIGYIPKFTMNVDANIAVGDSITIQVLINNGGSILSFDYVVINTTSTDDYELDNFQEITGLVGNKITISADSSLGGSNIDITISPATSLTASSIVVGGVSNRNTIEYDETNNVLATTDTPLSASGQGSISRLVMPTLNALTKRIELTLTNNLILGNPSSWDDETTPFGSKTSTEFIKTGMSSFPISYLAVRDINIQIGSGTPNNFDITVTVANISSGSVVVLFQLDNSETSTTIWDGLTSSVTSNGSFTKTITWSQLNPEEHIDTIRIFVSKIGGGTSPDVTITISPNTIIFDDYQVTETKTIQLESECRNPVYLFWKNSLGGDTFWLFDWTQQYTHSYADGKKAKRMVLYADGLSFNQFEAIDELNTPGNIFDVPIIELTTSVNKTSKKNDQQVYVVQPDGSKLGVVVITSPASTQTKRRQHFIEIEIEFPETFL